VSSHLPPELVVVMHGVPVASLRRHPRTRALTLEYLAGLPAETTPLSVSMPLAAASYAGPGVANWITGLLPDRPGVLRAWRRTFAVTSLEEYALLEHIGRDVAGAAQFARPDRVDEIAGPGALEPLTDREIADRLAGLATDASGWGVRADAGQFSLAGSHSKLALHHGPGGWAVPTGATPTTHIIKPAIATLPDQDINEHLTMRTARLVGLRVPTTSVVDFASQRALVVERYDRAQIGGAAYRVHQEDVCQALGVSPARRYEADGGPGAADVAGLLRRVVAGPDYAGDALLFLEALGFNWFVGGTDAHAKNFSLVLDGSQVRLAPLYDVNSFLAYPGGWPVRLSMSVGPGHFAAAEVTSGDWQWLARRAEVSPDLVLQRRRAMAAALPDAASDAAAGIPGPYAPRFVDAIAEHTRLRARSLRVKV